MGRLGRVGLAIAATAFGAAAPRAAAVPTELNWVLYELRARTVAHGFGFSFEGPMRTAPGAPVVYLSGFARAGGFTFVRTLEGGDAFPSPSVPSRVELTATGLVTVDETIAGSPTPERPGNFSTIGGLGFGQPLQPGDTVLALFAVPAGRFTERPRFEIGQPDQYDVTLVAHGADASYVDARAATNAGTAVGVNDFGPVAVTATASVRKGAVISPALFNCYVGECAWTWQAPDGQAGTANARSIRVPGVIGSGSAGASGPLGGPKGTWTWTLDAPVYDGRLVAAYVPVGDYWTAFRRVPTA